MHSTTTDVLQKMALVINLNGLHCGDQFAQPGLVPRLDICALAYTVAERITPDRTPDVFFTDEDASLRIIEASASAMAAIRAISDALDSSVCETQVAPGYYVPDYIEHVSNWAATASPVAPKRPPTTAEVIGRILRAANQQALQTPSQRPGHTDAYGTCLTCHGHGTLTAPGEEIPYEELSPRRQQGHDLGHRFYRNTSKPCPHCDGQDRATEAAVSAHEATL
jgi:cytochrome c5